MKRRIPLAEAARRLRLSEETLAAAVAQGLVAGERNADGTWVDAAAVEELERDPAALLRLPLRPADVLCAQCGLPSAECRCE